MGFLTPGSVDTPKVQGRSATRSLVGVLAALCLIVVACGEGRKDTAPTPAAPGGTAPGGSALPAAGFSIDTSACEDYQPTKGIDEAKKEIVLGSSFAQSGLYVAYAAVSKGYEAYFKSRNEKNPIRGYKVRVETRNDEYTKTDLTRSNTDELIDKVGVFAMFNVVGTPNNTQIEGTLEAKCIPNLFAATGSSLIGKPGEYKWTIGSLPTYTAEMKTFAAYLKTQKPAAKIGMLRQDDEVGAEYLSGLKNAIGGTAATVVSEQKYSANTDLDVSSQIAALKNSGADTVVLGASGPACISALNSIAGNAGWNPVVYGSATCASKTIIGAAKDSAKGVITAFTLKEVANPDYASDSEMTKVKADAIAAGLTDDDLTNSAVLYGWTMGAAFAAVVEGASALDRKSVMEAAYNMKAVKLPTLLPGSTLNTNGVTDPYMIETLRLGKWNGTYFEFIDEQRSFEGQTGGTA